MDQPLKILRRYRMYRETYIYPNLTPFFAPMSALTNKYWFEHGTRKEKVVYQAGTIPHLVVSLHGYRVSQHVTKLRTRYVQESGFHLLYPRGYNDSWNGGLSCCGTALELGLNDTDYVARVVHHALTSVIATDIHSVFLMGQSNGSFMVSRLTLQMLERNLHQWIAGIALVAGYSYDLKLYNRVITAPPSTAPPPPILALHGMKDQSVLTTGSKLCASNCTGLDEHDDCIPCVSFRQSASLWQTIHRCGRTSSWSTSSFLLPPEFETHYQCTTGVSPPCVSRVVFCELERKDHAVKDASRPISAFFLDIVKQRDALFSTTVPPPELPVTFLTNIVLNQVPQVETGEDAFAPEQETVHRKAEMSRTASPVHAENGKDQVLKRKDTPYVGGPVQPPTFQMNKPQANVEALIAFPDDGSRQLPVRETGSHSPVNVQKDADGQVFSQSTMQGLIQIESNITIIFMLVLVVLVGVASQRGRRSISRPTGQKQTASL